MKHTDPRETSAAYTTFSVIHDSDRESWFWCAFIGLRKAKTAPRGKPLAFGWDASEALAKLAARSSAPSNSFALENPDLAYHVLTRKEHAADGKSKTQRKAEQDEAARKRFNAWRADFEGEEAKTRAALAMLGLAVGATVREIKKAFRSKALVEHPDRGGTDAGFIALVAARDAALAAVADRAARDAVVRSPIEAAS